MTRQGVRAMMCGIKGLPDETINRIKVKRGGNNMDWMDFNHDGKVDAMEQYMGMELLCSSKEEHEALFGDAGDFDDEDEEDEDDDIDSVDFDSDDFDSDDF